MRGSPRTGRNANEKARWRAIVAFDQREATQDFVARVQAELYEVSAQTEYNGAVLIAGGVHRLIHALDWRGAWIPLLLEVSEASRSFFSRRNRSGPD